MSSRSRKSSWKSVSGSAKEIHCPVDKPVLRLRMDGSYECVETDVSRMLSKIETETYEQDKRAVNRFMDENNLTELVGPYMADPVQQNLLKYILGSENVDKMTTLNALVYSGVVNAQCPPPSNPTKTEAYTNIMTGKVECREPIVQRRQATGPTKCPEPLGDPLALEHYIDFFGKGQCRRPVISGQFSCPPAMEPTKTQHITLADGTGICVEPHKKVPMPDSVVFPPEVNKTLVEYIQLFQSSRFTPMSLRRLGTAIRSSRGLGDLKQNLSGDPEYELFLAVLDKMQSPSDIRIAQTAVVEVLKSVKDGGFDENKAPLMEYMKFYGLTPQDFRRRASSSVSGTSSRSVGGAHRRRYRF